MINNDFINKTIKNGLNLIKKDFDLPSMTDIEIFIKAVKEILFPQVFSSQKEPTKDDIDLNSKMHTMLNKTYSNNLEEIKKIITGFLSNLPKLQTLLIQDAKAIYKGDPSATNLSEIIVCFPGFEAILNYRIAHVLYNLDIPVIPRMITELSHSITGVDIHPAAKIGHSFCIDHGTGIVIGGTAVIGNNVKLYQGVTLGAFSVSRKNIAKRHPTIEDNVTVYARSTILGGDTVIGKSAVIGGNTWITSSIPAQATIYLSQPSNQKCKL